MNNIDTGRVNIHGRPIYMGLRGGKYVKVGARKVYKKFETTAVAPVAIPVGGDGRVRHGPGTPRNNRGRQIYIGPRGGKYVKVGARKVYI